MCPMFLCICTMVPHFKWKQRLLESRNQNKWQRTGRLLSEIFSSWAKKNFEPWVQRSEFIISTLQKSYISWKRWGFLNEKSACFVPSGISDFCFWMYLQTGRSHVCTLKLFSLCLTSQVKQHKKWKQIQKMKFPIFKVESL